MNILLDTHMAICALLDSPKLTSKAKQAHHSPRQHHLLQCHFCLGSAL